MSILNTTFAVETADRAIKSFFQGVILAFAGGVVNDQTDVNAWEFDWSTGLGMGVGMAVLSIATSFASGSLFKESATPASALSPPPVP